MRVKETEEKEGFQGSGCLMSVRQVPEEKWEHTHFEFQNIIRGQIIAVYPAKHDFV